MAQVRPNVSLTAILPALVPVALGAILIGALFALPVSFFLYMQEGDALQYQLMAQSIAKTGTSTTSLAVNLPPFSYAAGTSYIYAPVMLIFHTFATQIRAIQCINVAMIGVFVWLAIRYFQTAVPYANIAAISAIATVIILIDVRWQHTAMVANSDILPAIITLASFLIARNPASSPTRKLATLLFLGIVGFFIKISLLSIPLVFMLVEFRQWRWRIGRREWLSLGVCLSVVAVAVYVKRDLVGLYANALLHYPGHPLVGIPFGKLAERLGACAANLVFAALPNSVVPNLGYLFLDTVNYQTTAFGPHLLTPMVVIGMVVGMLITAAIAGGAIKLWKSQPFEVALAALCTVIFALIPNSTGRYLLGFAPFFWVCLLQVLGPTWSSFSMRKKKLGAVALAAIVVLVGAVETKSIAIRGRRGSGVRIDHAWTYVHDVASAYGQALDYLNGQRRGEVWLVAPPMGISQFDHGTWSAATGIPAYSMDGILPATHNLLLVLSCRRPFCESFGKGRLLIESHLAAICYRIDQTQNWSNNSATVEIDHLVQLDNCSRTY